MRSALFVLTLALGSSAVLALVAGPTAASPPPASYGPVTLTVDSACNFTAKATWSHAKVDSVQFTLHMSGPTNPQQTQTATPKGRTAASLFALGTGDPHTFFVTAYFFLNGTQVGEADGSSLDVECAFPL